MTFRELLENAHLDAMGFLDAEEQAAFDAAFYAASPSVRAQIRDEQARWARMEASLPQVEPGAHLRDAVLERIREAIGAEQDRIGVHSNGNRRWNRTAMIALGTAALAFGAAFFTVNTQNQRMAEEFAKNKALEGPLALFRNGTVMQNVLASSETVRVSFAPVNESFVGEAALWLHPSWNGEAKLVINGLVAQPGRTFRLVAIDASNKVIRELSTFQSDGTLALEEVNVSNLAAGVKLAVLDSAIGEAASANHAILIATYVRA